MAVSVRRVDEIRKSVSKIEKVSVSLSMAGLRGTAQLSKTYHKSDCWWWPAVQADDDDASR